MNREFTFFYDPPEEDAVHAHEGFATGGVRGGVDARDEGLRKKAFAADVGRWRIYGVHSDEFSKGFDFQDWKNRPS